MPDATDADRRPVPHPRADPPFNGLLDGLTEALPEAEPWTGNWATEHPPQEHPPHQHQPQDRPDGDPDAPVRRPPHRRTRQLSVERWSGWLAAVLMLAAAAALFWAPWEHTSSPGTAAGSASSPAVQGRGAAGSAGPGPRAVAGGMVPTRISIPAIGVDTTVEHRGTVRAKNPFTGRTVPAFGVPSSMRTTSWWSDGPAPGSGQMAVILGHTQVGGYGVFNRLGQLQPGAPLTLTSADGATLHLQVLGRPVTGLDKATSALSTTLDQHPAGAALALVTCGGQFDQRLHASQDNVVVFAAVVPAG